MTDNDDANLWLSSDGANQSDGIDVFSFDLVDGYDHHGWVAPEPDGMWWAQGPGEGRVFATIDQAAGWLRHGDQGRS